MMLVHLNLVILKLVVLLPLFPAMIMMLVLMMDVILNLDVLMMKLTVMITTNVLMIAAILPVVVNMLLTLVNIKMPATLFLVILFGDANTIQLTATIIMLVPKNLVTLIVPKQALASIKM
jgi:hypothetical protein